MRASSPRMRRDNQTQLVRKWKLKFTVHPKDMSVISFLERIDELKVARKVSDQDFFASSR